MVRNPRGVSALGQRAQEHARKGRLSYLGIDRPGGLAAVEVHGQTREFPPLAMMDWLDGFDAGQAGYRQPPELRDRERIATVRSVLVNPPLIDQVRIRVRVAMERDGRKVGETAQATALTIKAFTDALRFGTHGTIGLLTVLGHDPAARPDLADRPGDAPLTPGPLPDWDEPDALARLRALGYAHEQGVVRWIDPTEVNKAFHARRFVTQVGDHKVQVFTDSVRTWLVGVADAIVPDAGDALYAAAVTGHGTGPGDMLTT